MGLMERVKLRALKPEDMDFIAGIDKAILGSPRPEYWEERVTAIENHSGIAPIVADLDGKVIGFVIGETSGWEYGVPEEVGWIHTVGVDPEFQGEGVGALMVHELLTNMKSAGVTTVYTLVHWKEGGMLRFFDRMGFDQGDMINLQKKF